MQAVFVSDTTHKAPSDPHCDQQMQTRHRRTRYALPTSANHGWGMKEYRLLAWPELPAQFQRTIHRRMLSDLSHRYMTVPALMQSSGANKLEVRAFLETLDDTGLLESQESDERPSIRDRLGQASDWVKDTFFTDLK
jgi:hypothetical protein